MSLRARKRHTHWRRAQTLTPQWCQGWWRLARAVPSPNVDARPQRRDVSLVVVHSISLPPGVYGGDEVEAVDKVDKLDIGKTGDGDKVSDDLEDGVHDWRASSFKTLSGINIVNSGADKLKGHIPKN